MKFVQMIYQPAHDRVGQQFQQGKLYERIEKPQNEQGEWKIQNEGAEQRVSKTAFWCEAKKILEIWREASDQ
jgi:hypothetical protein